MSRRRRFTAPRTSVGVHHLVALMSIVLVMASGTAFTASLTGTPRTSVVSTQTDFPDYQAGIRTWTGALGGPVTVRFTVTPDAGQVQARVQPLIGAARTFQPCTRTTGLGWSCPVPGLTYVQAVASTFSFFANP